MNSDRSAPDARPRLSARPVPRTLTAKSIHPVPSTSTRFGSLSDPDSLRVFASNLREGIYISSRDGRILDANPAFLETFGVSSLAELGEFAASEMYVDSRRRLEQLVRLDQEGSVREFEIVLCRPDGGERTVLDTCYLIKDPETGEEFIHGIVIDITARKELESRLLELSTRDPLTGALNRRYLMELARSFDSDPYFGCGCIFIDIDHFKHYNDTYGHQAGDDVLVRIARFLTRYSRFEEVVIRYGGDEFVVIIHDADSARTKLVAERLRNEALEHAPVPFSLGWAAREPGESVQDLLDRADQRMLAVRVLKRQVDQRRMPSGD